MNESIATESNMCHSRLRWPRASASAGDTAADAIGPVADTSSRTDSSALSWVSMNASSPALCQRMRAFFALALAAFDALISLSWRSMCVFPPTKHDARL